MRIQIPLKAGFIIGPLAICHFKWRFAGGPMMARYVMLAWYMCRDLRFSMGSGPVLLKNYIFVVFQWGSVPPVPPLDPPMIRLLPSAN